ncbi:hybrid sensor histidine kinase/response regulator, partial [Enterobacter sp. CM29]
TLTRGRSHQPAIAMTAHAMQGDQARCLAMGFDGYIAKPVSQEALREEIARVVAGEEKGLPDEAHLLKQCADDPDLVNELLALFGNGLDEAMAAIERSIVNDDREALRRAAHKLRGEAVTLGFACFAETLQYVESQAVALNQSELSVMRGELIEQARRSMAWLHRRGQEVKDDL